MKKMIYAAVISSAIFSADCFGMAVLDNGRISFVMGRDGAVTTYEYDAIGNIKREGNVTFQYSDAGQLKSSFSSGAQREYKYDDFGRMISDGEARIEYSNINGMMDKYERLGTKALYGYDELTGLRTSKTVNGEVTHFVLDDLGRVIEERDDFENTIARIIWNGDLPSQYIFGDQAYDYQCNSHGDVVALVDEKGAKVNSYSYDIWGKLLKSEELVPNPIRYNHEYQDTETGFYYLRGRYYDPAIRRFTTPDPAEDGINFYAYCGNNPIQYIDPSGYVFLQKAEPFTLIRYYSGDDLLELVKDPSKLLTASNEGKMDIMSELGLMFGSAASASVGTGVGWISRFLAGIALGGPAYVLGKLEDKLYERIHDNALEAYQAKRGLKAKLWFSPEKDGEAELSTLEQVNEKDTTAFDTGVYSADDL